MFNCCSLYSGSSGNSFFIQSDHTNILIDVGVSTKKIVDALHNLNFNIEYIDAILITHEHVDHTRCLGLISSKYNIPVYANKNTWNALSNHTAKMAKDNIKLFNNNSSFSIGDFSIFPFSTSHDAVDPCGFNITYKNKKVSIATDIGQVDSSILENLKNSCFLFLESNYDPSLLKYSSYPRILKERITSSKGHLSNTSAGQLVRQINNKNLENVLLIHLSKENNFPELAYESVNEQLKGLSYIPKITVAPRNNPSPFFNII